MKLAKSLIYRPKIRPFDKRNFISMFPDFSYEALLASVVGENFYNKSDSLTDNRILTGDGNTLEFLMDNGALSYSEQWNLSNKITEILNAASGAGVTRTHTANSIFDRFNDPAGLQNSLTMNGTGILLTSNDNVGSGQAVRNMFHTSIQDKVDDGAGEVSETILSPLHFTINAGIRKSSWSAGNTSGVAINDWAPTDLYSSYVIEMDPTANINITGLDGTSAVQGLELVILNISTTFSITLTDQDVLSAVGNRFVTPSAANVVIPPGGQAVVIHGEPSVGATDVWYAR